MRRIAPILLLAGCAAAFVFALLLLIKWRFDVGDVYPPYSSLRADPLGTMVLYESLRRVPGISVQRDFRSDSRMPDGADTTYLHLAADEDRWREMPAEIVREIERFMAGGGRLVIALSPRIAARASERTADKEKDAPKPAEEKEQTTAPTNDETEWIALAGRWGLGFGFEKIEIDEEGVRESIAAANVSGLPLPRELEWNSGVVLEGLDPAWRVIYSRGAAPVIAERNFGLGSMVAATDSFFVSNEAMLDNRHADLLAWLVGPNHHVVFDEAHFGVLETPGIAALARKYRLHGAIVALLVLAGLFIWKNASSLVPPSAVEASAEYVRGRDSAAGFVGLLRRSIKPDRLLEVCVAEWSKTFSRGKEFSARERQALDSIFREERARPARERKPLDAYLRICAALRSARHPSGKDRGAV